MPDEHAKLSPSGSETWFNCPASVTLVERLGLAELDTSTPAADFGTQCHQICEEALAHDKPIPADIPVTMRLYATRYVAYIKERQQGREIYYEGRVKLDDKCWGTSDVIMPDTRIPAVIDLKTGQVPVYAKESKQLRIYALALLRTFGIDWDSIDGVELTIHQPSTENISTYVIPKAELQEFEREYHLARQNLVLRPMHYQPSPKACLWCRAKPHCEAFERVIEEEARVAFLNIQEVEAERLATMLQWLPTVKRFIEEVQSFSLTRLEEGRKIPGYKLSNPYSRRVWNELKLKAVARRHDIEDRMFYKAPVKFANIDALLMSLEDEAREQVEECIEVNVGAARILQDKS